MVHIHIVLNYTWCNDVIALSLVSVPSLPRHGLMGYETISCQFLKRKKKLGIWVTFRMLPCLVLKPHNTFNYNVPPFWLWLLWHRRQDNLGRMSFATSHHLLRPTFKLDSVLWAMDIIDDKYIFNNWSMNGPWIQCTNATSVNILPFGGAVWGDI